MDRTKKKLGDWLIEAGMITDRNLQEALNIQKRTGERLGTILVNQGFTTEHDIMQVLARQLNVDAIKLGSVVLLPNVTKLVPEALIKQQRVVPVKKEGNKLFVAMPDPLNLVVLDDLHLATGLTIVPMIAMEQDIDGAIKKLFGFQDLVNQAILEFEIQPQANLVAFDLDEPPGAYGVEAPTVRIVNSIIKQAVQDRASDIHIEPRAEQLLIRFRIDGVLKDILALPKQSHASVVSRIKIMGDMDIAEKRIPLDGRIQVKIAQQDVDLRVSTLPTIFGEKVVIRILDKSGVIVTLDKLGLSPDILPIYRQMVQRSYGMIIITGPTGSGKTTTLYSTISEINAPEKNIVTIEDPVEYVLEGINQIRVNDKAGLNFANGLRAILRQDPDILLIGEIRDGETAGIAVRAATTGHLVLTTLHTNDAAGALPRLIDMGIEPFLVASTVIGVMAQRLVRLICPLCKEAYELAEHAVERKFMGIGPDQGVTLYRGSGCPQCSFTGYRGRIAIQELLPVRETQQQLILARSPVNEIAQSAIEDGMLSLTQDGIQKALLGLTTIDEVMRVATTGL
ncbi:ATPase, T2SS/T4P/T4SS family [Dehalobacterium formicoaceticum]|uniref:ATPase, T2SS/T4P/T4SS family n=1 Tax=Dehalobacterium formicoaceticum TaxID=51515 RepID=UPI000B7F0A57